MPATCRDHTQRLGVGLPLLRSVDHLYLSSGKLQQQQTFIYQVRLGRLCGHRACFDCARHRCGMMGVFLRCTVRALCMSPNTGSVHVVKLGFPCALIVTHFVGVNESCTKLRGSLIFGSAVRPIPAGCYFLCGCHRGLCAAIMYRFRPGPAKVVEDRIDARTLALKCASIGSAECRECQQLRCLSALRAGG